MMTADDRAKGGGLDPSGLASQLGGWATGSAPLYRELAAGVERLVRDGALRLGDRLPAERSLAAELSVARGTVVAAYDELRAAGVVERRRGSGTRVAAGATGLVLGRSAGDRADAATVGDPLFTTVPDTIDLLKAAPPVTGTARELVAGIDLTRHADAWAEVEPAGIAPLREALARHHTAQGLPTTPAEVMVTAGGQQAIALVVRRLVGPGDVVVAEELTWPGLADCVRRVGGRIIGVPMDAAGVDVDELRAAIERHRPVLIALNPHHHNPTGTRLAPERRRRVADLAADHAVPILEDRVAAPLAFDGIVPPPLAQHRPDAPSFTVESFSKVAWLGLRIGWVRSDAATIHELRVDKALADLWSAIPSQLMALELLDLLDASTRERIATLRHGAQVLGGLVERHLPDWELAPVRGGMVAWLTMPNGSASAFARFATRYGVAVASSREFATSVARDDHVRVPFTQPAPVLTAAVERLAAAWEAFPGHALHEPADHAAIV